jgi:hypothetical protein
MINTMIEGLIFKCPFEDEEFDCPFAIIRQWKKKERIEMLQRLSEDERHIMYLHHSRCLRKRE